MNNVAVVSMETLVTGITATIWIVLLIIRIVFPQSDIPDVLNKLFNSLSTGNLLISSILMYNIGWIIHHLSEIILDTIAQTKYRRTLYNDEDFYTIRSKVFQKGSTSVMDDIRFDRHVLRISRSNTLNFLMLSIILISYIPINSRVSIPVLIATIIFTIISWHQWVDRYKATYKKFMQLYAAIEEKNKPSEKKVTITPNVELDESGIKMHLGNVYHLRHENVVNPLSISVDDLKNKQVFDLPYVLKPNEFILGETIEKVHMDGGLIGFLDGRSSLARFGLSIHCTSALIDKMHDGEKPIVLEIKNNGQKEIVLTPKMYIGNLLVVDNKYHCPD